MKTPSRTLDWSTILGWSLAVPILLLFAAWVGFRWAVRQIRLGRAEGNR